MTSIRRLPTPAERGSRQSQFRPGHVGGRVASAQPIRRRGGTLAGPAIGAAGAEPEALPPPVMTGIGNGYAYSSGGPMFWNGPKAVGDLLVAIVAVRGSSTCPPPAGWTTAFGGAFTGLDGTYTWSVSYGVSASTSTSEGAFNGGAPINGFGQGFIMRLAGGSPAAHPVLVAGPFTSSGTSLTFPAVPTTAAVHPVQHMFAAAVSSDVQLDAIYSPTVPGAFPVWFQGDTHGLRFDGSGPKGAKVGNPTAGGPYPNIPQNINLQNYFTSAPVTCNFVSFVWGWSS